MTIPRIKTAMVMAGAVLAASLTGGNAVAETELEKRIAEGKVIFEETAGGVGCATCHGIAATGDPDAGAPSLIGVTEAQLDSALGGAVPVMEFIELDDAEREAVFEYLNFLARGPEANLGPLAAAGKVIFEETAGGVGCASCHGEDGSGDIGPDIRGRDALAILEQLRTNEQMAFIELSEEEVEQVEAYLRVLHDQEAH